MFSATEIIAIIVALGAVIVNIIVALRTGGKIDSISQVTAQSLVETTALQGQVQQVHTLTNSNLSEVKADLRQSVAEISALKAVVLDLKTERDKIATAAAYNTPPLQSRPSRATDVIGSSEIHPLPVKIIADDPVPVQVQEQAPEPPPPSIPTPVPPTVPEKEKRNRRI